MGGNVTTSQQQQQQQRYPENLVVVKMGVDELRALITDVVQKAVEGLRAAAAADVADSGVGAGADGGGGVVVVDEGSDKGDESRDEDGDGDEIVVAGGFAAAADDVWDRESES